MADHNHPVAIVAAQAPARVKPTNYPQPFASRMVGRQKHPLGDLFGHEGQSQLSPGMCAGFRAGTGNGHCLINETTEEVVYLEVGDRTPDDEGSYPDDDLKALLVEGKWKFVHKNGEPYG